jgi:thioredoxin/glutathione reductase (selenoprotein)
MNPQFNVSFGSESKASAHISSPFVWSSKSGYIGGCDALLDFIRQGLNLRSMGSNTVSKSLGPVSIDEILDYDYDLVVIGGGSGGLACSMEAAKFGKKVCVLDYVKPSPQGTTWGIGGTCVNVGCIPKKLMHQSSIIGEILHKDAGVYGWNVSNSKFEWTHLVDSINNYVKSLNFKYKVDLRDKKVKYENFLGSFVDKHTIELSNPKKGTKILKAKHIVISVGGRPKQLTCPGGELAITSDDIFWRKTPPGKTLVVGASYVALECAGFLRGMGYDVTVMVRSILLRGFDQDIANKIGEFMEEESKISFIRGCVPLSITKLDGGKLQVKWKGSDGLVQEGVFDTVLNATGRYPDVEKLQLENAGVLLNDRTGKILVNQEQTSTPNIFALGDVIDAPELTPVAIKAGRLLARRLYAQDNIYMDYEKICTAVFTPLEYGCCGLSEEASIEKLGAENVEVYHQNFAPLEWSLSHERIAAEKCYCKVVCDKSHNQHVVGFHYLGPNAGEVTQAIGLAMKLGFTYDEISSLVGIHPTTAEVFTTLEVTKSSGADAAAGGC